LDVLDVSSVSINLLYLLLCTLVLLVCNHTDLCAG
jgi:hypothetical protein